MITPSQYMMLENLFNFRHTLLSCLITKKVEHLYMVFYKYLYVFLWNGYSCLFAYFSIQLFVFFLLIHSGHSKLLVLCVTSNFLQVAASSSLRFWIEQKQLIFKCTKKFINFSFQRLIFPMLSENSSLSQGYKNCIFLSYALNIFTLSMWNDFCTQYWNRGPSRMDLYNKLMCG